ncbi:MAG: copper chaperone PCu(A)C [Caldilineaceae bacterium]
MVVLLCFALLLAACAAPPPSVAITGDAVRVDNPSSRPAGASQNGAAYFTIVNPTEEDDRLLSASSGIANFTELHESRNDGGVMRMTHHADGVAVPAHSILSFAPGGHHVMLMNLHQALRPGQTFTLTLTFAKAGEIGLDVPVNAQP